MQTGQKCRNEGAPQVIGHHDGTKLLYFVGCVGRCIRHGEWPRACFDVGVQESQLRGEGLAHKCSAVNRPNRVAAAGKPQAMAPMAAGYIEHAAAGGQ